MLAFSVCMGWKTSVGEAVIYVMVIGLSVDYVIHLGRVEGMDERKAETGESVCSCPSGDAYLECPDEKREDRVQFMDLQLKD